MPRFKRGKSLFSLLIISIIVCSVFSALVGSASAVVYKNIGIANDGHGSIFLHVNNDPPQYYWTSGVHSLPVGTGITFTATPQEGYSFSGWTYTGDLGSGSVAPINPLSTSVQVNFYLTAHFVVQEQYYDLTLNDGSNGHSHATEGATTYNAGIINVLENTEISLEAVPDSGYAFVSWTSGIYTYTSNPYTLWLSGDVEFTPAFALIESISDSYFANLSAGSGGDVVAQYKEVGETFPQTHSGSGVFTVGLGGELTFIVVPLSGYTVQSVMLNSVSIPVVTFPLTVTVASNYTLIASFLAGYSDDSSSDAGSAFINGLVPVIVVLVICGIFMVLGWFLMGSFGAVIGINLSVFCLYSFTPYMPLYGVVGVIVCDALLFFGKLGLSRSGGGA
jgi:hypothetical protein